jgi:hypothetical protein
MRIHGVVKVHLWCHSPSGTMCEAFFADIVPVFFREAIPIYGEEIASTGTERRSPLRTGDDVAMTQSKKSRL